MIQAETYYATVNCVVVAKVEARGFAMAYLAAIRLIEGWPPGLRDQFVRQDNGLRVTRERDAQSIEWKREAWTSFLLNRYPGTRIPETYRHFVREFENGLFQKTSPKK